MGEGDDGRGGKREVKGGKGRGEEGGKGMTVRGGYSFFSFHFD